MLSMTRRPTALEILVREATNISLNVPDIISEQLNRAVSENDVNVIRELHKSGSESLEDTLKAIVRSDNDELLSSLVETIDVTDGAIRDKGSSINCPVLRYAIKRSALKCVWAFMKNGVNTDCVRGDLMKAAVEASDIDMISRLITTSTLEEDQTYALLAARLGNAEALDTIIHHKHLASNAELQETGDGLLHVSARSDGEGSVRCINLLLDKYGLNIEKRNKRNRTPLHVAAEGKH